MPSGYESPAEYLRSLSREGLANRFEVVTEELTERLEYELEVIISMGFEGYFLIVMDYIRWAKQQGIPSDRGAVRGRVLW